MRASSKFVCNFCLLLGFVVPLHAQRPILFTENPSTSGSGKITFGAGLEYLQKSEAIPMKAPISVWRIPVLRSYLGVGEIVDVVVDWRGRLFSKQGTGRHVSDWGDLSIGTKIHFLRETKSRPSLGIMYLVKLPNSSHDELLGSNETDVFLSLLATKKIGRFHLRANAGLGILDDPDQPHTQLDIYTTGIAITLPFSDRYRVFAEWTGFLGSHRDQDKFVGRGGVEISMLEMKWNVFGSFRVIGDKKDFGTAFEYSESWGVGMFLRKEFALW